MAFNSSQVRIQCRGCLGCIERPKIEDAVTRGYIAERRAKYFDTIGYHIYENWIRTDTVD